MRKNYVFCLLLLSSFTGKGQECNCPETISNDNDGKPHKVYTLGKQVFGICGYQTIDGTDTTYTQFSLIHCADGKVVKEWGASRTCKMEKVKDSLIVMDIYGLPVGQSFSTIRIPFVMHKFYFKNGELQEVDYFKKGVGKYSKSQVEEAIKEYKVLPREASEQTMRAANMMFCAYMSGSKEAESYLLSIPEKFSPLTSTLQQEWDDIMATYRLWKEKNNK